MAGRKTSSPRDRCVHEFQLLPVIACQPIDYEHQQERAADLIGERDSLDIPLLALALARGYPVWSDDRDFEGINEITLFKTADLVLRLTPDSSS